MALTDDLVIHLKLNEASGTRFDSTANGLNLSDNNTVTQAAGKIGDAALFTSANSEYLSHADDAGLSVGGTDYSITLWVYLTTVATSLLIEKGSEWSIRLQNKGGGAFRFETLIGGGIGVTANTFGLPSSATWYFIHAYWDLSATESGISVNDGTVDTASNSDPSDQATAFALGSQAGGIGDFLNGRLDSVSFWKRKLTASEVTDLYNGGSGFDYPFTTAAPFAQAIIIG